MLEHSSLISLFFTSKANIESLEYNGVVNFKDCVLDAVEGSKNDVCFDDNEGLERNIGSDIGDLNETVDVKDVNDIIIVHSHLPQDVICGRCDL